MDYERKLASIQRVIKVEPIKDADRIECISVLGWKLVAEKDKFKDDDLLIYIEIDSLVPKRDEFADIYKYGNGKVRTAKMRGQYSQGYPLPLDVFKQMVYQYSTSEQIEKFKRENNEIQFERNSNGIIFPMIVGLNVTSLLGIVQYKRPISQNECILNDLPSFIFRTDEPLIQSHPEILERYSMIIYYATEKMNGESSTFYNNNGYFGVGSRNVEFKDEPSVPQWKIAHELGLPEKMAKLGRNIALQGELLGKGVQGNDYKIDGYRVMFFNAIDLDNAKYMDIYDLLSLLELLGLEDHIVPMINDCYKLPNTIDEIENYVNTENYGMSRVNPKTKREGIVFRAIVEKNDLEIGRLSFKSVSKAFSLKHD